MVADNTTSILDSTKKMLGIDKDYDAFDIDILIHINSAISKLTQLGVGPDEGYEIVDSNNAWSELLATKKILNWCKTFVYLSVKLMFDPNMPGPVIGAYERQITELTWRINVAAESDKIPFDQGMADPNSGAFMWILDSNNGFPDEAKVGDFGINPNTFDVYRKTS